MPDPTHPRPNARPASTADRLDAPAAPAASAESAVPAAPVPDVPQVPGAPVADRPYACEAPAADAPYASEGPATGRPHTPQSPVLLAELPDGRGVFGRALPFLVGHRMALALTVLLNLTAAALAVGVTACIGQVVDAAGGGDRAGLVRWMVLLLCCVVVSGGTAWASRYCLVRVGERVLAGLRERATAAVGAAPLRFVEAHRGGDLLRRLTGEVAGLAAFVGGTLPDLVTAVAVLGLTAVMLAGYAWPLMLLLTVAFAPAAYVIVRGFHRGAGPAYAAVAAAESAVAARFTESLPAQEELRTSGAVPRWLALFAGDNERLLHAREAQVRAELRLNRLTLLQAGCVALLLVVSAALVGRGTLTVGVAVVFVLATRDVLHRFEDLAGALGDAREAQVRLARLLDLIAATAPTTPTTSPAATAPGAVATPPAAVTPATAAPPAAATPMPAATPLPVRFSPTRAAQTRRRSQGQPQRGSQPQAQLRPQPHPDLPSRGQLVVSGLEFGYRAGRPVIGGLSLTVERGDRLAVVGETGSGKSTLGKLLAGLYRPDAGTVSYAGHDLATLDEARLRARIVLVPQEVVLVRATLAQNLALVAGRPDRARLTHTLDRLGLAGWVDSLPRGLDTPVGPRGLSAGERQLVAIARAALTDPAVLILDEATAGVDHATAARIEEALAATAQDRALVVIAHRADTIARGHRLLTLPTGRITQPTGHPPRPAGRRTQPHPPQAQPDPA
ncbi:ABC transporter ATP-binding protein [Streptomyces sp. 796.1]|uniref:ABC transporter ATP-binding protein n=1 Tax=Streptomyces sp. 796.1 TaxID=3163029 RepID=UPI0039C91B6A